jgi:hypothetical protein
MTLEQDAVRPKDVPIHDMDSWFSEQSAKISPEAVTGPVVVYDRSPMTFHLPGALGEVSSWFFHGSSCDPCRR